MSTELSFSVDVDGYIKKNQLEFMKDEVCVKKTIQYQYPTVFNYDEVVGDKYELSKEIKVCFFYKKYG